MEYRKMMAGDLDAVFALDAEAFGADAWPRVIFTYAAGSPLARYTVVYDGDMLVAVCGCYDQSAQSPPCLKVDTLAVRAAYRRQGIGRRLMEQALDLAREVGAAYVTLETAADNAASLALYASLGFAASEACPGYYPSGKDAVKMRLEV